MIEGWILEFPKAHLKIIIGETFMCLTDISIYHIVNVNISKGRILGQIILLKFNAYDRRLL